jgi:hypothetical protein
MTQDYKIISYSAIFPMVFSFYKENKEITLNVEIDFLNKKVYFGDNTNKYPDLDFLKLEEKIFEELTPQEIETPEISEDVFERAKKVREEDYSKSFTDISPEKPFNL